MGIPELQILGSSAHPESSSDGITSALSSGVTIYLSELFVFIMAHIFVLLFLSVLLFFSHSGSDPCSGFQSWFAHRLLHELSWSQEAAPASQGPKIKVPAGETKREQTPLQPLPETSGNAEPSPLPARSLYNVCDGHQGWNWDRLGLEMMEPGSAGSGDAGTRICWDWRCWNQDLLEPGSAGSGDAGTAQDSTTDSGSQSPDPDLTLPQCCTLNRHFNIAESRLITLGKILSPAQHAWTGSAVPGPALLSLGVREPWGFSSGWIFCVIPPSVLRNEVQQVLKYFLDKKICFRDIAL